MAPLPDPEADATARTLRRRAPLSPHSHASAKNLVALAVPMHCLQQSYRGDTTFYFVRRGLQGICFRKLSSAWLCQFEDQMQRTCQCVPAGRTSISRRPVVPSLQRSEPVGNSRHDQCEPHGQQVRQFGQQRLHTSNRNRALLRNGIEQQGIRDNDQSNEMRLPSFRGLADAIFVNRRPPPSRRTTSVSPALYPLRGPESRRNKFYLCPE